MPQESVGCKSNKHNTNSSVDRPVSFVCHHFYFQLCDCVYHFKQSIHIKWNANNEQRDVHGISITKRRVSLLLLLLLLYCAFFAFVHFEVVYVQCSPFGTTIANHSAVLPIYASRCIYAKHSTECQHSILFGWFLSLENSDEQKPNTQNWKTRFGCACMRLPRVQCWNGARELSNHMHT